MDRRQFMLSVAPAAMAAGALPGLALAQDTTLRLHQFLPPASTIPSAILVPFGERLTEASGGRLSIQHFDAMSLGGAPPELIDQARDGVVDLVMTLPGYTPGRFPRTEVFELPFMMTNPVATSLAYWEMMESEFQNTEYQGMKILAAWVHGPGLVHSEEPVEALEDMRGKTVRGPTRVINNLLAQLGAEPVGMPVPAIPEALSKGVINGTVIPWEVTASLRLSELVGNHTEFGGEKALYSAAFVLAMNQSAFDALDPELQGILMEVAGANLSQAAAQAMWDADAPARAIAEAAGNRIITLPPEEVARWEEAAQPVIDNWIAEMDGMGIDGQALIDQARSLIAEKTDMSNG